MFLGLSRASLSKTATSFARVVDSRWFDPTGRSFTHLIKVYHEEHHKLVTNGIYGFVRHPSYCGFFIWSVGTQIMMCNPISTIGFAFVVWKFFEKRIPYEEYFLRQFFGPEYEEYARRVPSGVPFVK
ncbi:Isoprenylcysteine carboxyl methyltransferase [Corchorus olitorius]|uniref:Protein-S-isoprenylcysteine O-methyltransferase n=1 Tax=Corchorus olitorius TaxID=93759 RepID=A0A1R3J1S1_9ROSI|nr:Isoprenylcysteine carboxyl methyltransferase [Corchorus olitorius]